MELVLAVAAILGAAYLVTFIGAAFFTALKNPKPVIQVANMSPQTIQIIYSRIH